MSKNTEKNSCPFSDRLGKVGGQAVLEGVMMKAGNRMVTTCRKGDGSLVVTDDIFVSAREKHKILDLPIIRGVVSFAESMITSFKTLGASADALGLKEEEPSKFEKWLSDKLGLKVTDVVMVVSLILGLGLSALLFVFLPIWITAGINFVLDLAFSFTMPDAISATLEGLIKMAIFVGYLAAVSLMPDIKRTFMYHGAEHKSIACFASGISSSGSAGISSFGSAGSSGISIASSCTGISSACSTVSAVRVSVISSGSSSAIHSGRSAGYAT